MIDQYIISNNLLANILKNIDNTNIFMLDMINIWIFNYHFLAGWGPWRSFSSYSLRIWFVLFWASTLFLCACKSSSCCCRSFTSISLIFCSNYLTWSSSSDVLDFKPDILFSISFFFCSACNALLIPNAIEDSYRVW